MSVVQSLPGRPLTHSEGDQLRDDGRILDVTYTFDVDEQPRLISLIADSGDQRHLVAFHPDRESWVSIWSGSDETDGDPLEVADSWSRDVYGWPAEKLFNIPGSDIDD